jgi:hypothetical protein
VDGKKKSVPGMNTDAAKRERQESHETQEAFKESDKRQETKEELDMQSPHAISNLQAQGQESEKKFTTMDVDRLEMKNERAEAEVKRNPDGSICEDCN